MTPEASPLQTGTWLTQSGPRALELLLRALVYQRFAPILIADNERRFIEVSTGATKLLGLSRDSLNGRSLDDFVEAGQRAHLLERWQAFLKEGNQKGTLNLLGTDGCSHEVAYFAKEGVLPTRHLLVLQNRDIPGKVALGETGEVPSWLNDVAFFLLNESGEIVAWYAGAERIYGYAASEALGHHSSLLYPADDALARKLVDELNRSAGQAYSSSESWCMRKDGSRFWANAITMAIYDGAGKLQGYARAVRDFTGRHQQEQPRKKGLQRGLPPAKDRVIIGVVSGEFDRIIEANDAFLEIVCFNREDLQAGRVHWPELTPPEDFAADEHAHEEVLRFGACTPFRKHLIRKDGTLAFVQNATSVITLLPYRWISFIREVTDHQSDEEFVTGVVDVTDDFEEIIGRSAALKRTLTQIELVAPTDATVLILGETGTGKELVARAVHRISLRRDRPFVTLNCAAIPTGLLESELFGYERGAFTGALARKIGRFEMANRGTLFLDEVGDIPLELQPKLLRALQEKSFERLGGTKTIPIDVRLVAATNRNLGEMMGSKLFRADLYYRLNVFPITTAPLRDHPEDIPALVWHFTHKYAEEMKKHIEAIPPETMQALECWQWPGNVRELENFIERSVILSPGSILRAPLAEFRRDAAEHPDTERLDHVEREHILKVLKESGGIVSRAAIRLGVPRTTLNAMMEKLAISRKDISKRETRARPTPRGKR